MIWSLRLEEVDSGCFQQSKTRLRNVMNYTENAHTMNERGNTSIQS